MRLKRVRTTPLIQDSEKPEGKTTIELNLTEFRTNTYLVFDGDDHFDYPSRTSCRRTPHNTERISIESQIDTENMTLNHKMIWHKIYTRRSVVSVSPIGFVACACLVRGCNPIYRARTLLVVSVFVCCMESERER